MWVVNEEYFTDATQMLFVVLLENQQTNIRDSIFFSKNLAKETKDEF